MKELSSSDGWLQELGELGEVVQTWRSELIADLGGPENITTQQRAIVDVAAKTLIILSSVDSYLLRTPFIDRRKRSLRPIVQQRQQLVDSLVRCMEKLGLERRQKPVPSLQDYLKTRTHTKNDD